MAPRLGIVTATTNQARAHRCLDSWRDTASDLGIAIAIIPNGGVHSGTEGYLGTVPAFRRGVDQLLHVAPHLDVIACFHDDLEILEPDWDRRLLDFVDRTPGLGLCGFGGALALGDDDLYQKPYAPVQLARQHFRSNLVDAETHGIRSLLPERVACLDGFSQIGRRDFWEGRPGPYSPTAGDRPRPWTDLEDLGVIHHFYDGMLGCLAARMGWETWYLPVRCRHYGGQTAVGDPGYQRWAEATHGGDRAIWEAAHRIGYEAFRDVLPLRVAQ
jgi:hypothetical protein